jgi:hypothetical protein
MIHNTFEECDEPDPRYTRVQEVVADAFTMADSIHDECRSAHNWNEPCFDNIVDDEVPGNVDNTEEDGNVQFDSDGLEEAVGGLYEGAKSSTLAATILLLNLCIVHGVSNCFMNELFCILHGHILLDGNSLPRNNYAARTLTRKLGLTYNTIHACESGCVLFRGVLANATECPQCRKPRFKDQTRQKFPVKVLRHFPIIPRLQRMFRSPTISDLLTWHSENRSDREGGDNMVRHPCDSQAWRHFYENVDPDFGLELRNIHFALAADGVNPFKQTVGARISIFFVLDPKWVVKPEV